MAGFISPLSAQLQIDLESGAVFSGYNDVRIPNKTGTLISLKDDLSTDAAIFYRVKLQYTFSDKHTLGLLVAPLRLKAEGSVNKIVHFEGVDFPANAPLIANYRFDSYRLTYRYNFYRKPALKIGAGLTAKIRDASIKFESGSLSSEKPNTGFVPLFHFMLDWRPSDWISLYLDADALASPQGQGRAEDVLAALRFRASEKFWFKIGYRLLEGGADVDEVYNFTLLHYLLAGITYTL